MNQLKVATFLLKNILYKSTDLNALLSRTNQIKDEPDIVFDFFTNIIERAVSADTNSEWVSATNLPKKDIFKYVNDKYHIHYIKLNNKYEHVKYHYCYNNEDNTKIVLLYLSNTNHANENIKLISNQITYILKPKQYYIIDSVNFIEFPKISDDNTYHLFVIPLTSDYIHEIYQFRHDNINFATYDEQIYTSLKDRLLYQCYNTMDLKQYFIILKLIENVLINETETEILSHTTHPNMKLYDHEIHASFWPNIHKNEYTCTSYKCYVEDIDLYNVSDNYIYLHTVLIKLFDITRNYHEYTNLESIHTIHMLTNGLYILKKDEHINGIYIITNHTHDTLIVYDSQQQNVPYGLKPFCSILFNISEKDTVFIYNPTNNKCILTRYMYI